jgi:arylsulfatase A-like enzyme
MKMTERNDIKSGIKNVILLTVDSLRADHTTFMRYNKETTPNLEKLSKKSIIFEKTMSSSSFTPASFISMFSSAHPLMYDGYKRLPEIRTYVVEVLNKNGYITAGFNSNPFLSRFYGYNRGFDVFEDFIHSKNSHKKQKHEEYRKSIVELIKKRPIIYNTVKQIIRPILSLKSIKPGYIDAHTLNKSVVSWIKSNKSENFFLWVHYMDVHYPYIPPPKYIKMLGGNIPNKQMIRSLDNKITYNTIDSVTEGDLKTMINLYDAGIRYVDEQIGLLLSKLKKLDLLNKTAIIVIADHGDEFLDHGDLGHGSKLYNELLQVPLLLYLPNINESIKIKNRVSLIDLAPTILDLLRINNPSSFLGESLLPLIEGKEHNERAIISEIANERITPDNPLKIDYSIRKIAYIYGDWKYIYYENADDEFYNLKNDPKETKNVLYEEKEKAEEFKSWILQHIKMEEETFRILNERKKIKKKIKKLKRGRAI